MRSEVSPARFIPLAEESGLIHSLGQWVLRTACEQGKAWIEQGIDVGRIAVNVSGAEIQRGNLVKHVKSVLEDTGFPASNLELEVTDKEDLFLTVAVDVVDLAEGRVIRTIETGAGAEGYGPFGGFEGFGDNSLTLLLRAYLSSVDHRVPTITDLHKSINRKFEQAGIVIAFPQRDIHVRSIGEQGQNLARDDFDQQFPVEGGIAHADALAVAFE